MAGGYFITGTSTDVGKTFVTTLLLTAFRASGLAAVGYKPVACGSRADAAALRDACEGEVTLDEVNPLAYRVPAAPMAAVMIENVPLDWDAMLAGAKVLRERFPMVLVEGVGGWKVPCTAQKTMADLAVEIGWPVIVVVDNRLGALNHTLLTLESIASHGLSCAGLILNQPNEERDAASISNTAVLSQLVEVPILAEIMYDQDELELPNELCG